MILLTVLFLILFEAVYEGLALRGKKTLAGVIEGIYLMIVTIIVLAWISGVLYLDYGKNFYFIVGGYVLMRFALFDIVYNLVAGLPLFFIGTTKITDKLWQKFFNWSHFPVGAFFGMLKFICFCIGLTWLITNNN